MGKPRYAIAPLIEALDDLQAPMPAHYCKGKIGIAFVFSVPGAAEQAADRPVAGETGRNLCAALEHLCLALPGMFKSKDRYDYRITNAFAVPIARSLGHSSSEASNATVCNPNNISRVIRELENCSTVVLSGRKAQLLRNHLEVIGKFVISVPHAGNSGLNSITLAKAVAAPTPTARRLQRIEKWSNMIIQSVNANVA